MMNQEVEQHIKDNYSWAKLPPNVKQALGNSEKNWAKSVSDYSIKNQLRFKGSYYETVQYRIFTMLYPIDDFSYFSVFLE